MLDGANSMARNVLVVDDEYLLRQIISIILKSSGYKVIVWDSFINSELAAI